MGPHRATNLPNQEPEGWQALLEACAKCRALNVLSLKGCALGSLGERPERLAAEQMECMWRPLQSVVAAHTRWLAAVQSLPSCHAAHITRCLRRTNHPGEAAAEQVAQLLGACQISVLDASQNGLVSAPLPLLTSAAFVVEARQRCSPLAAIPSAIEAYVLHDPLLVQGDAFASALARSGVLANGRLAVLDLSDNAVTCAGASSLAAALQAAGPRAALRQLDLGYNRIGDAGAEELAAAVAAAPVVASLELERNQVRAGGTKGCS